MGVEDISSTAACCTRDTRSSGGGPRAERPSPPARSGRDTAKSPTPSVFDVSVCPPQFDPAKAGTREDADADLLVWTTTPWTLPSNQFVAVKPDLEYSIVAVEDEPRKLIIASALVDVDRRRRSAGRVTAVATRSGRDLLGQRYLPPFDDYYRSTGRPAGVSAAAAASTSPGGSWPPIS